MTEPYEIHVISNTHWDREWLYDFQETRAMLVELLDGLLDLLEKESRYVSFLFDGQSVAIEDYLEIRPENRERLRKQVAQGRLLIGPWYTLPECFSVSGESLVRNLLYGHRVAAEHGGVMKIGHTPFSYGQNSQMPQIYRGFGIDTMHFYHGVKHTEVKNEFIFEGADGTQLLATQMSSGARYNFYHNVYRPAVFGKTIAERMYEWSEGGLPFHLCGEGRVNEHHILLEPVMGLDLERAKQCMQALRQAEIGVATTRYLAFMMGHDSSVADEVTLRLIEAGKECLAPDTIQHSSLPALVEKLKGAVKDLKTLKGERRTPGPMGSRMHLYSDVLSSRSRVKRLNALAEKLLQRRAEPFAALAWPLGAAAPTAMLDLAWKTLLKCHAHDSISGSGVDDIERDVRDRLRQVTNLSKAVLWRSLAHIQSRINNADAGPGDVLLTVFNASPKPRSEVITVSVDIPRSLLLNTFALETADGKRTAVQLATRRPHKAVINHPHDATYMMDTEKVTVHFPAGEAPALGYTTYKLRPADTFARGSLVCGANAMENEHIRVTINRDGTFDLLHKSSGARFPGLHYFEDGGEAGHAWMHIEPGVDRIISSKGAPVSIALEENGPFLARYRIDCDLQIPARLEEGDGDPQTRLDGGGSSSFRSEETVPLRITSRVTLRSGAKSADVNVKFNNTAKNHRLRVLFPTYRKTDVCHVESAFDAVERAAIHAPTSPWYGGTNATFPMQRFLDMSDTEAGLAIINDGLLEYEITQSEERAIALTLLRAYQVELTTVSKRWEPRPEMTLAQAPGEHEFRYLIYPHTGDWADADVFGETDRLNVPLEVAQTGAHAGDLPKRLSLLSLSGPAVMTALKLSEDGNAIVMRVFNPASARIEASITCHHTLRAAHLVSLEETPVEALKTDGHTVRFTLDPKKIATVRLDLERI